MKQHTRLYYPEKTTVSWQDQPAPDGYRTTAQCDVTLRTARPWSRRRYQMTTSKKNRLCKTAKAHLSARRMPLRYGWSQDISSCQITAGNDWFARDEPTGSDRQREKEENIPSLLTEFWGFSFFFMFRIILKSLDVLWEKYRAVWLTLLRGDRTLV